MAEGPPLYVNVKKGKHSTPKDYRNVGSVGEVDEPGGDPESYQIVHQYGLDPNGEYTNLTLRKNPDEVHDAALLQREKILNDLLFPAEKNAPKRFNYTDIQLMPVSTNGEDQLPEDVCDSPENQTIQPKKPKTKPKPPRKSYYNAEDEVSVYQDQEEEAAFDHYEMEVPDGGQTERCSQGTCSYCSKFVYAMLLVVCVCASLVAVTVAVVAITKPSIQCNHVHLHEECEISPSPETPLDNCTTSSFPLKVRACCVCLFH
jgi:hypothetical protein